jgi:hypothetical protein
MALKPGIDRSMQNSDIGLGLESSVMRLLPIRAGVHLFHCDASGCLRDLSRNDSFETTDEHR